MSKTHFCMGFKMTHNDAIEAVRTLSTIAKSGEDVVLTPYGNNDKWCVEFRTPCWQVEDFLIRARALGLDI